MSSEAFDVKICQDALKFSIQADQPHHNNIIQALLLFQDGTHEEVVCINGIAALITTLQPPQFLQCSEFNGLNTPHYLLVQSYKKKWQAGSEFFASTPTTKSTSESDFQTDSDVSGAPLESPFAVHESDAVCSPLILRENVFRGQEKLSFNGFPLKRAQQIAGEIRKVIKRRNKAIDLKAPIFIVCDGLDRQKTIFLGVGANTFIKASCSPVFHSTDNLPSISHLTYNFISGCYSKAVETSAEARYEVLKRANDETSSVTIHCCWMRPSGMLSLPTVDLLSDIELYVHPSDPSNAAHNLQMELSLLESLIIGADVGEMLWDVKERQHSVLDCLKKLFEDVNERKRDKPDQSLFELDNLIEHRFLEVRQNLDFTDQLWNVLKDSQSYNELQTGFSSVFEAINNDSIRPFIHELDITKLAKCCKEMMRGEKTVNVSDLEPLQMLIEIGLEKIKRDYMSVFLASELVTNDELDSFISWSSIKHDPKRCLKLLNKLCLTLQCIVLLRKYINIPQTILSQCTTNIFKRLVNSDELPRKFNFDIQNILLQGQFTSSSLEDWAFKISSTGENDRPKQMIYRVTKMPLFQNALDEDYIDTSVSSSTGKYHGFCLNILPDSFIP